MDTHLCALLKTFAATGIVLIWQNSFQAEYSAVFIWYLENFQVHYPYQPAQCSHDDAKETGNLISDKDSEIHYMESHLYFISFCSLFNDDIWNLWLHSIVRLDDSE